MGDNMKKYIPGLAFLLIVLFSAASVAMLGPGPAGTAGGGEVTAGGEAASCPSQQDSPPHADNDASNDTPKNFNFQATVDANDLLIAFMCNDGVATISSWDTTHDWTEIYSDVSEGTVGLHVAWRVAVGDEDSAAGIHTISAAERSAWIIYRLTGAKDPTTDPPEAGGTATGASETPDSGSFDPPAGDQDFMVVSVVAQDSDTIAGPDAYPTNYDIGQEYKIASSSQGCTIYTAADELSGDGPFDPGAWDMDYSDGWVAAVVTIEGS
jgi:hypothetical protein